MEIKKVRMQGNTKIVIVPSKSDIKAGDYIKITKIIKEEEAVFQ